MMDSEAVPLLEASGLVKRYPGTVALDGVDFDVGAGEVHGLMGGNGAGKSTLIRVIAGAIRPDGGTLRLGGRAFDPRSPRAAEALGISTVHQENALLPQLSVAENVVLGREPVRFGLLRRGEMRRRTAEALDRLGIHIDPGRALGSLSTALRQLVAIARALDTDARVLILDEPTSSLDAAETGSLFAILRRLRGQGLGIVFVTHFLEQVYAVADRITVLRDGRRAGTWPAAELPRAALVEAMLGAAAPGAGAGAGAKTSPEAPGGIPVVEARGLARRGSVGPVDFTVRAGEAVGLAGLLGSGRTETARLLFGLHRADAGEVRAGGAPARLRSPRDAIARGFGFLSEDRKTEGLVPALSVRENIVLALQARRGAFRPLSRARSAAIASRFIDALRIRTRDAETPVAALSGGNQQKVLLARWLATDPRFLILDEPTRGVDIGAKAEIRARIDELRRGGLAVLLISSEIEEVVEACGRLVVLRDRRQAGTLEGPKVSVAAVTEMIARHAD